MGTSTFQVVFDGETIPGASLKKVKENVAQLFKAPVAKVEPLFSGKRFVIKKHLDEDSARKYQAALKRAGALAEVVEEVPSEPVAPSETVVAPSPRRETPATGRAESGALANARVDEPGVVLIEAEAPAEPRIDTSHLSMDPPGVRLVESQTPSAPQVNTDGLSLDEPGVRLVEPEEVAPPDVDTSALSLDAPGVILVEPEPVETPAIDTSALGLKD